MAWGHPILSRGLFRCSLAAQCSEVGQGKEVMVGWGSLAGWGSRSAGVLRDLLRSVGRTVLCPPEWGR